MLDRDGSIHNVALAHADPERLEIANRLRKLRPVTPDAPTGIARVIREGTTEMAEITPEMIEAARANLTDEEYELVNGLGDALVPRGAVDGSQRPDRRACH